MDHYATAEGDCVRVTAAEADVAFVLDGSLTMDRSPVSGMVAGVVTTDAHADEVHDLFRTGTTFAIEVDPAEGDSFRVEGCTFLSSSGKWNAVEDG